MRKTITLLLSAVFFMIQAAKAQEDAKADTSEKAHWEAALNYLSNSVYLGRQDSTRIPYLTPSLDYYTKSGFYFGGSMSYLGYKGVSRIDFVSLQAGYTFIVSNFEGDITATRDFYNKQSENVKAEAKGALNTTFSYDFKFIKPIVQAAVTFSTKNDYYAAFGLEHSFFTDEDNLEIAPSFMVNASTQNTYSAYYSKRKYAAKNKTQRGPGTLITAILLNASKFKIMDYEFSMPVNFSTGKFLFNFTPTAAIPVNANVVITTTTPPSGISVTRTRTEKLSGLFFWSAGFNYTF
ncbi:MAG: hypothetical protein ABI358_12185 [Ginsengibacter sp.]